MSSRLPVPKTFAGLLGLIAIVFAIGSLSPILTPFVFAVILGYILNPGVDKFVRMGLNRTIGVSIMMLVLLLSFIALLLLVIPVLQSEGALIQEQVPKLLEKLNLTLAPWMKENLGLRVRFDPASMKQFLSQTWGSNSDDIIAFATDFLKTSSGTVLTVLGTSFLVPVVMFYLLIDWYSLVSKIGQAVPVRWQAETTSIAREIDLLLAQYLRGQIAVMSILACYYAVSLLLIGLKLALPIGILTGLLIFIPYVGFAIGMTLALLAATLEFQSINGLLYVLLVYGAGQVLESMFLTPKLLGERIGLHPLAVIFALVLFGYLLGFMGVLLALPISAAALVGLKRIKNQYLSSDFYNA
jgi:predicted PurR-regulated permease PerM